MNKQERQYIIKRMQQITNYFLERLGNTDVLRGIKSEGYRDSFNILLTEKKSFKDWFKTAKLPMPTYEDVLAYMSANPYKGSPDLCDVMPAWAAYCDMVESENNQRNKEAREEIRRILQFEQAKCDEIMLGTATEAADALNTWNEVVLAFSESFTNKFLS